MGRKSLAEIENRRCDVREYMLEGKPTSWIIAAINIEYKVSKATIERDMTTFRSDIIEMHTEKKEYYYELLLERRENLYRKCMAAAGTEEGGYNIFALKQADAALLNLEKLLGYHKPKAATEIDNRTVNILVVQKFEEAAQKEDDVDKLKGMIIELREGNGESSPA